MSRTIRALASAIGFLLIGSCPVAASTAHGVLAQLTLPTAPPSSGTRGIVQAGAYLTAPVQLDGSTLFRIATLANAPAAQMPIDARLTQVQSTISQLVAEDGTGSHATTVFSPGSLRIHARVAGDAVVLEAVDAKHADPLPIVTVTAIDARANSVDVPALASQWQSTLQSAVVKALVLRQPAVEARSLQNVIRLAIGLVALTLIAVSVLRELWRRMAALETEIGARTALAESQAPVAPEDAGANAQRRVFFALALRTLKPAQRLGLLGAIAETILWALAVIWIVAATWSLSLFAETTPLAQSIGRAAFGVATTIVIAILLSRALDAIITRTAGAWRLHRFATSEDRARSMLRVPTIARAIRGAKNFSLVFVATLSGLGQLGVPIGSVITIGGLTAIALSLAAQNFVRDFLNGFLVLLEDQYVVGDYVTINAFSGIVERLTLRMVQIRDAAGDVVTIPHSSVTSVVNQSRNWSRVDYRVPIDAGADPQHAITIVRAQIAGLAGEDDWTHGSDDPIEWIGIDGLSKDSVIVRASVRTAPLRQFELRRRINERVLGEFGRAGIALGAPIPPP